MDFSYSRHFLFHKRNIPSKIAITPGFFKIIYSVPKSQCLLRFICNCIFLICRMAHSSTPTLSPSDWIGRREVPATHLVFYSYVSALFGWILCSKQGSRERWSIGDWIHYKLHLWVTKCFLWGKKRIACITYKLDGVGPVDNRPSTE